MFASGDRPAKAVTAGGIAFTKPPAGSFDGC